MSSVRGPIPASLCHGARHDSLLEQLRLLHQVHIQARGNVPRNVTMERPDAGVVRVVLYDEVAVGLQELHVTALRIGLVDYGAIPCTCALGQDVEVVA